MGGVAFIWVRYHPLSGLGGRFKINYTAFKEDRPRHHHYRTDMAGPLYSSARSTCALCSVFAPKLLVPCTVVVMVCAVLALALCSSVAGVRGLVACVVQ